MYFRAEQRNDGNYRRADGKRFTVQQCRRVRPAEGWTFFENIDAALETWGLRYAPMG